MAAHTKPKPENPDVQKTIGGRAFTLRFSLRAISALKQAWGLTKDDQVSDRVAHLELEDVPTIIWATARAHHPDLTVEDALDLVDAHGLAGIKEVLEEVVRAAMPPESPPAAAARTTR